jgi:gmma-aminobutyric acid receptor subunit gamma/cGMP-dependent protein kinase 2
MAAHNSNTIIKFADDTAVVGLISNDDETAYREEIHGAVVEWWNYHGPHTPTQL